MSKLLITGQRDYSEQEPIRLIISRLPSGSLVIQGGATGADSIADEIARELGYAVATFPALWGKEHDGIGRMLPHNAAGNLRNQRMLDVAKPDVVAAFFTSKEGRAASKGTRDCVVRALRAQIPTIMVIGQEISTDISMERRQVAAGRDPWRHHH